ncbi:MAG: hypothetical protein KA368_24625, partial [Acidobacteria bacterium]|nr:hypothetical protein [Acidobacteriota bacterium]
MTKLLSSTKPPVWTICDAELLQRLAGNNFSQFFGNHVQSTLPAVQSSHSSAFAKYGFAK